jgi:large subunit ribosomal protein L10
VRELQALRPRLRPKGVEYHVVKNSLFGRAATASDRTGMTSLLSGPTAVALAGVGAPAGRSPTDEVELARGLVEETRTLKALKILGAFVDGKVMSADDVQQLSRLPGLPVLQATIVGSLQAPLGQLVGIMTAAQSNLVRVLAARSA